MGQSLSAITTALFHLVDLPERHSPELRETETHRKPRGDPSSGLESLEPSRKDPLYWLYPLMDSVWD
jgi:hypothetical protein